MNYKLLILAILLGSTIACKKKEKEPEQEPQLIFRMKIDPNQERLDVFGQPSTIPAGNATQTPKFNGIAVHYIELTPNAYTQVGEGEVVYYGVETTAGGDNAIHFDEIKTVKNGEIVYSVPLSTVKPGEYDWARVSVAYQNYEVEYSANGYDLKGTLASFVGYNTYIKSHKVKTKSEDINGNKLQGYWAFENESLVIDGVDYYPPTIISGQAPGTTVPNPLHATSPIPAGSCLVTGGFPTTFKITGKEKEDVIIDLSFGVNNSFEWKDENGNGKYDPLDGDVVVDMGLRGLIPMVAQ